MHKLRLARTVTEFDTAQATSLADAGLHVITSHSRSAGETNRRLTYQLQTTLDSARILEIFFEALGKLLVIGGFSYYHAATAQSLSKGTTDDGILTYRLNHEGENLGELTFCRSYPFEPAEVHRLEIVLAALLFPLRNSLLYLAAQQNALRDPLTGAGNRLAMQQTLNREFEVARRHGQPMCLLMLDIDHFKPINDRYGHPCGDEVLKAMVSHVRSQMRSIDLIFRYGGEEFLILLTNTPPEAAEIVGQRLCESIRETHFNAGETQLALTVSIGGAGYRFCETIDQLIARADDALYLAKRGGRNQLRMA